MLDRRRPPPDRSALTVLAGRTLTFAFLIADLDCPVSVIALGPRRVVARPVNTTLASTLWRPGTEVSVIAGDLVIRYRRRSHDDLVHTTLESLL